MSWFPGGYFKFLKMGCQKGHLEIKWVSDSCAQYILSGVFCFTNIYVCHFVMCILYHDKSAWYLIPW